MIKSSVVIEPSPGYEGPTPAETMGSFPAIWSFWARDAAGVSTAVKIFDSSALSRLANLYFAGNSFEQTYRLAGWVPGYLDVPKFDDATVGRIPAGEDDRRWRLCPGSKIPWALIQRYWSGKTHGGPHLTTSEDYHRSYLPIVVQPYAPLSLVHVQWLRSYYWGVPPPGGYNLR